jgi:hypothetical protein
MENFHLQNTYPAKQLEEYNGSNDVEQRFYQLF